MLLLLLILNIRGDGLACVVIDIVIIIIIILLLFEIIFEKFPTDIDIVLECRTCCVLLDVLERRDELIRGEEFQAGGVRFTTLPAVVACFSRALFNAATVSGVEKRRCPSGLLAVILAIARPTC